MSTATKPDYPRCRTCKWWMRHGSRSTLGDCAHPVVKPVDMYPPMQATDTCDCHVPRDGCVQHEPRESEGGDAD